jgi:hypothetical protein
MIEALAQLLGWLIIYSHSSWPDHVLIRTATLTPRLRPGFKAEIRARSFHFEARFTGQGQMT